jgi:hypothetical protein
MIALLVALTLTANIDPHLKLVELQPGTCTVRINGVSSRCTGLLYMYTPSTHRVNFSVGGAQTVSFSGGRDSQPTIGSYGMQVDRMFLQERKAPVRASGSCKMMISQDGRIVYGLNCRSETSTGSYSVEFTGTAKAIN